MCSSLNCLAVTRSYRLNGETFYYARQGFKKHLWSVIFACWKSLFERRGCTLNPEDGLQLGTNKNPDMRKDPDSFPYNGVTNVDTYVTRSIETKGNGYVRHLPWLPYGWVRISNKLLFRYSNYQPTTAQSMSCFQCKGEVTVIKQPSQGSFKNFHSIFWWSKMTWLVN